MEKGGKGCRKGRVAEGYCLLCNLPVARAVSRGGHIAGVSSQLILTLLHTWSEQRSSGQLAQETCHWEPCSGTFPEAELPQPLSTVSLLDGAAEAWCHATHDS